MAKTKTNHFCWYSSSYLWHSGNSSEESNNSNSVLKSQRFTLIESQFVSLTESDYGQIFECQEPDNLYQFMIDAGTIMNSPYPLMLRPQRRIDIILSFDFSVREKENEGLFEVIQSVFPILPKIWRHLSIYQNWVMYLFLFFLKSFKIQ